MVLLTITPKICSALEALPESARTELSLPSPELNAPISHTQLIALSRDPLSHPSSANNGCKPSSNHGESSCSLNSLLRGAQLYRHPSPPKPEPSPEYLALKAKLEAEAETRKYNDLLHSFSPNTSKHQPSPIFKSDVTSKPQASTRFNAEQDDSDPLSPSLALNFLVSVLFTGFATYWALSNFRIPSFLTFSSSRTETYPGALSSQPFRVFASLFAAIGVGIAEVVVYAAYWSKVVAAKDKEKKVVEKKVVIGEVGRDTTRPNGEHGAPVVDMSEKLEIWGKGVNGGARRRVRERWKAREEEE